MKQITNLLLQRSENRNVFGFVSDIHHNEKSTQNSTMIPYMADMKQNVDSISVWIHHIIQWHYVRTYFSFRACTYLSFQFLCIAVLANVATVILRLFSWFNENRIRSFFGNNEPRKNTRNDSLRIQSILTLRCYVWLPKISNKPLSVINIQFGPISVSNISISQWTHSLSWHWYPNIWTVPSTIEI